MVEVLIEEMYGSDWKPTARLRTSRGRQDQEERLL